MNRKILVEVTEKELEFIKATLEKEGVDPNTLIDIIISNTPKKETIGDHLSGRPMLVGIIETEDGKLSWSYESKRLVM